MMKLTVNRLQELASSLPQSGQLNHQQQFAIKGGCTSCEDTRNPPGGSNSNSNGNNNSNKGGKG
jgi:hypothetical protein